MPFPSAYFMLKLYIMIPLEVFESTDFFLSGLGIELGTWTSQNRKAWEITLMQLRSAK